MNRRLQRLQENMGKSYIVLLSAIMSILILLIGYASVQPKRYNFQLNHVSELTIRAPKTVEDVEQTNLNKAHARERIPDVYLYQADIKQQQLTLLEQYLAFFKQIRKGAYTTTLLQEYAKDQDWSAEQRASLKRENRPDDQTIYWTQLSDTERMLVYQSELAKQDKNIQTLSDAIPESARLSWARMGDTRFSEAQGYITTLISDALGGEIEADAVSSVLQRLKDKIKVESKFALVQTALEHMVQPFIVPTVVYNEAETTRQREEAANTVQPSYILQGQILVQEGHVIDSNTLRQLTLFGYTDASAQLLNANVFYALILVHAILFIVLHTGGFSVFFKTTPQPIAYMQATVYSVAFVFGFALLKVLELIQTAGVNYATMLLPISLLPLLIVPKSSIRNGIVALISFSLMALFVLSDIFNLLETLLPILFYCFSGLIALALVVSMPKIKMTVRLFCLLVLISILTFVPLLIGLNVDLLSANGVRILIFLSANLLVSVVLFSVLLPYWEQLFNDRADLALKELANLNHPLLKRLIETAPGTYHHSMMVANLSSNAVEVIGGDSLLTRVGCYYHDVGKLVHPLFFVENLPAGVENPHKMVTPDESARIIIEHVSEGAKMLDEYYLPKSIIDICLQHHGTTLVQYFYHQAKQSNPQVEETAFRYPGPKPQTKEAAVIMIADSVEAASRTLKEYTQSTIEQLVESIVQRKLADNQFAECGLTVHELSLVKRSLITGVASMYHTRIEYPK